MPGNTASIILKASSTQIVKATVNLGKLSDQARRTEKATDKLARGFKRTAASAKRLANTNIQLSSSFKRASVVTVAAFGFMINEAVKFEKAMAEVFTLLDDDTTFDTLTDSVRELSIQYGAAPVDTAKALYQVISAGASDAASQMTLLNAANRLAIGGVTDVTTAADGLTTILNAYSLEASEAERVSDLLFVAMKAGKTTIGEMANTIGNVATIAAQTGVPINELVAAVAALTKKGIDTSIAMTSLRGILAAVLKPTTEATKAAEDMGVQFDTTALRTLGLAGFLESLTVATGGSEAKMALLVPRVEGLNAVLGLAANGAKEFKEILLATANAAGATDKAYDKMSKTVGFQLGQLKATSQVLAEQFGARLLPAVNLVAGALLKLLTPLKTVSESEKDAATAAKTMGTALRDMSVAALEAARSIGELAAVDLEGQINRIKNRLDRSFINVITTTAEEFKRLKEEEISLIAEQKILGKQLFRINELLSDELQLVEVTATRMEDFKGSVKGAADELGNLNSLLETAAARANPLWGELTKLNQTTAELSILQKAGSIDWATYTKWLDIAKEKFADAQREAQGLATVIEEVAFTAERMGDVQVDEFGVLDSLKLELELQGLGNTARRIRIALLEADATATSKLGKEIVATIEEIEQNRLAQEFNGAILSATNRFFDAFLDGTLSAKEAFAGFAKAVLADIARIIIQKAIMNSAEGGTGGIGGIIASLFAGKAHGGPVRAGTPYLVGERGPELIVPRNAGTVIPNDKLSNVVPINRNQTTNITVNLPPSVRRITAQQTASEVSRIQKRASSRNR